MATVGDIVLGAREIFPDLQSLGQMTPPQLFTLGLAGGPNALTGPYLDTLTPLFAVVTFVTVWGGETLPSNELSITGGAPGVLFISVGSDPSGPNHLPLGLSAVRVYIGTVSGKQTGFVQLQIGADLRFQTGQWNNFYVDRSPVPGVPPTRSSAWMPDSDGQSVSAGTVMRWLNEGLLEASTICDGVPDMGGLSTISGQPLYQFPGQWKKITSAWYDGYPLNIGRRTDIFRRNRVTGLSGTLAIQELTDRLIVELWPQPSRTPTPTSTVGTVLSTDTTIPLNPTSFLLPFGYARIGSGQNYEIVAYQAASGNQLTGVVRGVCGTVPTQFYANTVVNELNLHFAGHRVPSPNTFGSGLQNFYLPAGWEDAMETYLIARYRKAEQEEKAATSLLKEFSAKLARLMANKIVAGPRQVQIGVSQGVDTYPGLGSVFGGVIVP